MYKIDISFLKNSLLTSDDLKNIENEANNHYKIMVKRKLEESFHPQISGCLACGADCMPETALDTRRIIEVECKGMLGCHFCEVKDESLQLPGIGDTILIKCEDYVEIGKVKENSDLIQFKRLEMGLYGEKLPVMLRQTTEEDIRTYNKNLLDEINAKPVFDGLVKKHNLNMKLVNIHYQFDRKRLFFFYTSDGRVDFRELAKDLASQFKTRIELRQMGVRDEAKKIGGIGTCGREYCCTAFLSNFKRITTQLANDQNLISNLSKLSGPCGKLKCCLSFEIEEN